MRENNLNPKIKLYYILNKVSTYLSVSYYSVSEPDPQTEFGIRKETAGTARTTSPPDLDVRTDYCRLPIV